MGLVFRAPEGEVVAAVAAALILIVSHDRTFAACSTERSGGWGRDEP